MQSKAWFDTTTKESATKSLMLSADSSLTTPSLRNFWIVSLLAGKENFLESMLKIIFLSSCVRYCEKEVNAARP